MRVSVAAQVYDLDGFIELETLPDSDFDELRRRTNKVATLDGGVAVNNAGYTHADRELRLRVRPTEAENAQLRYIVETYATVNVSVEGEFYQAIPSYAPGDEFSLLRLSITGSDT